MKSPEAFRSISEAAEALGVRQHTLRSWETRFPFVRPVKRADGRRYYRPADIKMLAELKRLLDRGNHSTDDVVRIHRSGGLVAAAGPRREAPHPLRDHLAVLTVMRNRLAALLD